MKWREGNNVKVFCLRCKEESFQTSVEARREKSNDMILLFNGFWAEFQIFNLGRNRYNSIFSFL